MKKIMSSAMFSLFTIFLITSLSACLANQQPIRVADGGASGEVSAPTPTNPVVPGQQQPGLVPEDTSTATKSLDDLKDMCLNPGKYNMQVPTLKLEITGILTWSKWIKNTTPVYLVETQKMNNLGSFIKNGTKFDGTEWKVVDGKISDVTESDSSCVVEGICVEYVEHIYTRDLMNKSVSCEDIARASSVKELYGLSLENVAEITNVVPVKGDVMPLGFSDTTSKVYPAACPKAEKPADMAICTMPTEGGLTLK
ncbi:MAG: hypothetical protein HQK51_01550 [Oligoflexia bacterium]|nr:hypothetical protein [Oligoflexia bacterium]